MSDIEKRLEEAAKDPLDVAPIDMEALLLKAKEEIERLREQNKQLVMAGKALTRLLEKKNEELEGCE